MKFLLTSILFLFGLQNESNSHSAPQILDEYISWTQTGKTRLNAPIFGAKVNLTFQFGEGKLESSSFYEYQNKIEAAATSVSRSMEVSRFNLSGKTATAYISDISGEGDFSLVHILSLRKNGKRWRIKAIKVIEGPE